MTEQPLSVWLLVGEWLIAAGILAVAAAALWSLLQTRRAMRAETMPNLLLEEVSLAPRGQALEGTLLRATAVNLGRFPIYLLDLKLDTDALSRPEQVPLRQLIPPSEASELEVELPRLTAIEDGQLWIAFHYGATGATLHRRALRLVAGDHGGLIAYAPSEVPGVDGSPRPGRRAGAAHRQRSQGAGSS